MQCWHDQIHVWDVSFSVLQQIVLEKLPSIEDRGQTDRVTTPKPDGLSCHAARLDAIVRS